MHNLFTSRENKKEGAMELQDLVNLTNIGKEDIYKLARIARATGIQFSFNEGDSAAVDFGEFIEQGQCQARNYFSILFAFEAELFRLDPKALFLN